MVEISFLLRGLLIGFSIAAPVGPIGVLCIRRTLTDGRASGLVSGLGAATADALYGSIAGFGLSLVSGLLLSQQLWIRLAGGGFLCYLGVKTFLTRPTDRIALARGSGLAGAYLSTFFLTLANPMTILSFTAIFAGLGLGAAGGNFPAALVLALGVFTGSALWWWLLSGSAGLLRSRFKPAGLAWINRVSGVVILVFGLLAVISAIGLAQ